MEQESRKGLKDFSFWLKLAVLVGMIILGGYFWVSFFATCVTHGLVGLSFGAALFTSAVIFGRISCVAEDVIRDVRKERNKRASIQGESRFIGIKPG